MLNLKDLVPPFELCRKIPAGEFAESALVWHSGDYFKSYVEERCEGDVERRWLGIFPAPTLAEIMDALYEQMDFVGAKLKDGVCQVGCFRDDDDEAKVVLHATNPATAALRLWMQVKGLE